MHQGEHGHGGGWSGERVFGDGERNLRQMQMSRGTKRPIQNDDSLSGDRKQIDLGGATKNVPSTAQTPSDLTASSSDLTGSSASGSRNANGTLRCE